MNERKNLPVGVSIFSNIRRDNAYYVDKTSLIARLLDNSISGNTTLFTRPRRFGKSLALDMLHCFFDCTAKAENRSLFDGLAVAQSAKHMTEQGKYPVIRLSFNGAKYGNWEQADEGLRNYFHEFLLQYDYLLQSQALSDGEKQNLERLSDFNASLTSLHSLLRFLTQVLRKHHGQPVIILIDEYDVPIQGAYQNNYFPEMINFMRAFFTNGLKDNPHLRLAVLTGVMRIAKESLFSGLNNLTVDTILSERYADCFGFTQEEVEAMADYYDGQDKIAELTDWYDGYRFGQMDIYNPWSVLRYFDANCQAKAYWVDTSSNDLVIDFLQRLELKQRHDIWELYRGGTVEATVDTSVSYQQLQSCQEQLQSDNEQVWFDSANIVFSLMAVTGYLKPVEAVGNNRYDLQVPNAEVNTIFAQEILRYLQSDHQVTSLHKLWRFLRDGDSIAFRTKLQEVLLQSASYFDGNEAFYHGFMTCLLLGLDENYKVLSNREAGLGRADILLQPRFDKSLPGFVFEFKQSDTAEGLEQLAEAALHQIVEKRYAAAFPAEVKEVRCYGMAFCGKQCALKELAIHN